MTLGDGWAWLSAVLVKTLAEEFLGLYALPDETAFLCVTRTRLAEPQTTHLRSAHRGLDFPSMHGSYAPRADLASPMSVGRQWLRLSPGSRELLPSAHDNTAARRWLMRHRSVVLAGPEASKLVGEIPASGLRAEALGDVRARAEEIEEHPELLTDPAQRIALALDLCVVLHTATAGQVLTGRPAAQWSLSRLPDRERAVVVGVLDGTAPEASAARAFAWEVHRLAGTVVLDVRTD